MKRILAKILTFNLNMVEQGRFKEESLSPTITIQNVCFPFCNARVIMTELLTCCCCFIFLMKFLIYKVSCSSIDNKYCLSSLRMKKFNLAVKEHCLKNTFTITWMVKEGVDKIGTSGKPLSLLDWRCLTRGTKTIATLTFSCIFVLCVKEHEVQKTKNMPD